MYNIEKHVGLVGVSNGNRKEDTVISRLRIGHSAFNKSVQMIEKHDSGQRNKCGLTETVEHVWCMKEKEFSKELLYFCWNELMKLGIF